MYQTIFVTVDMLSEMDSAVENFCWKSAGFLCSEKNVTELSMLSIRIVLVICIFHFLNMYKHNNLQPFLTTPEIKCVLCTAFVSIKQMLCCHVFSEYSISPSYKPLLMIFIKRSAIRVICLWLQFSNHLQKLRITKSRVWNYVMLAI